MFRLLFPALFISICATDIIDDLCQCQSDKQLHFKEKKDKINPCNVIELNINDELIKHFNAEISQQLLQNTPIIKFPGKKLVKHDFMTLVLFKPVIIDSLQPESQQNIYIHWLISQLPSATSRFGDNHTFNLSPGDEYIPYVPPSHNKGEDNKYILAAYHQHETKDYYAAYRYRKFDLLLNSIGNLNICNILNITP